MTSTIPVVKARLVSILTAALPDSQVTYGPEAASLKSHVVLVGNVTGTITPSNLPSSSVTEQYVVNMAVSVSTRADLKTNTEAALADYSAACAAILTDVTLGLSQIDVAARLDGSFELSETADDEGRTTTIRFPVTVFAVAS